MQDPRTAAEQYLEQNKIPQLMEALTAQLLFHQPDQPRQFMCKFLEQVKVTGTPPLLERGDLEVMFGMFDITKKGVITSEQASAALKSILGPSADLSAAGVAPNTFLRKDDFVDCMHRALHQSAAYRPPTAPAGA